MSEHAAVAFRGAIVSYRFKRVVRPEAKSCGASARFGVNYPSRLLEMGVCRIWECYVLRQCHGVRGDSALAKPVVAHCGIRGNLA